MAVEIEGFGAFGWVAGQSAPISKAAVAGRDVRLMSINHDGVTGPVKPIRASTTPHHRRFFANAWPDPAFRYRSKASAFDSFENAM